MLDLRLQSGKVLALQGDKATVSTLLISMAVKLQSRSKVLYIDSANTFNPLFIKKNYHKHTDLDLRRIMVARPFTADQLRSIVSKLDLAATETRAKIFIISDLDGLFYDQSLDENDACFMFSQVVETITRVARKHDAVVLVGLTSPLSDARGFRLDCVVRSALDVCCPV